MKSPVPRERSSEGSAGYKSRARSLLATLTGNKLSPGLLKSRRAAMGATGHSCWAPFAVFLKHGWAWKITHYRFHFCDFSASLEGLKLHNIIGGHFSFLVKEKTMACLRHGNWNYICKAWDSVLHERWPCNISSFPLVPASGKLRVKPC